MERNTCVSRGPSAEAVFVGVLAYLRNSSAMTLEGFQLPLSARAPTESRISNKSSTLIASAVTIGSLECGEQNRAA